MPNQILLERDIYARLYNPQTDQFTGGISDIAYSSGITVDIQKRLGSLIMGLDSTTTEPEIYGFYGIGDGKFAAVQSHVLSKSEDTNRGAPVFSEYILVTSEQLVLLDWNIGAIFDLFPSETDHLQFTEKRQDLEPYIIDLQYARNHSWYPHLRSNWLRVEAVISSYLAIDKKVHIVSGHQEPRERQRFLSSLVKAFPPELGESISFSTYLGKGTNLSAKIFFSSMRESYSGFQIIDWTAAKIPSNGQGCIYARWVSNLLQTTSSPRDFRKSITDLRLPYDGKNHESVGQTLDAAVGFAGSTLLKKEPINSKENLGVYIDDLNKYETLLTLEELADRLSYVLNSVMQYSAYEHGFVALSRHQSAIHEHDFQERIAQRIVSRVLLTPVREQNLLLLSSFIKQLTEHGNRIRQPELQFLCQRILSFALQQKDCSPGLRIWAHLRGVDWASSDIWFETALRQINRLGTPKHLALIINDIGCPPSQLAFDALLKLLERSMLLSKLPTTATILDSKINLNAIAFGDRLIQSTREIKSHTWLRTLLLFGHKYVLGFTATLPKVLSEFGDSYTRTILKYAVAQNDELIIALVTCSIIRNEVQKHQSASIIPLIDLLAKCSPQYIDAALEIIEDYWQEFPNDQLESMLSLLSKKPQTYRTISTNATNIRDVLQRRNRITDIRDVFRTAKRDDIDIIVPRLLRDIIYSADTYAWLELQQNVEDRRLLKEYHKRLVHTLVRERFFNAEDSKLWKISTSLDSVGLHYEADVLVYWLFFQRLFFINPINVIQRTLDTEGVEVDHAAIIIGQENIFNRKYGHLLALLILKSNWSNRLEVDRFVKMLDEFLSRQTTRSLGNRLRLIVSNMTTDAIWIEACRLLSRSLKAEINRNQKGRK